MATSQSKAIQFGVDPNNSLSKQFGFEEGQALAVRMIRIIRAVKKEQERGERGSAAPQAILSNHFYALRRVDSRELDAGFISVLAEAIATSIEESAAAHSIAASSTYAVPSGYMAPTLNVGDLVEIDTTARIDRDGVYLLEFEEGERALRRIQLTPRGMARVWCDGTRDLVDEVPVSALRIIGRATRALRQGLV